ncbi:hypothetical protein PG994_011338 [Apiospora phragmitis]|uniref:Uncharacterized protein n=1 Tax=Apiospora phragmitis TaxID=2905665 RepID=A0ABR1TV43_9PEZI
MAWPGLLPQGFHITGIHTGPLNPGPRKTVIAYGISQYKTELDSLDPLLIYIHGFFNPVDVDGVLAAGANRFVSPECIGTADWCRTCTGAPRAPGSPTTTRP